MHWVPNSGSLLYIEHHGASFVSTAFHKDLCSDRCDQNNTIQYNRSDFRRSNSPPSSQPQAVRQRRRKRRQLNTNAIRMASCSSTLAWSQLFVDESKQDWSHCYWHWRTKIDGRFSQHSRPWLRRVSPTSGVWSLGVTIDDTLSFIEHVDNVFKSCNFDIRARRHIYSSTHLGGCNKDHCPLNGKRTTGLL